MPLLQIKNLTMKFRGLIAVNNFCLNLEKGEIVGLIGPNGSGKTTLFNNITGVYPYDSGEVLFKGQSLRGKKPHEVCALGIGRTFQLVKPFGTKTVLYNVVVGSFNRMSDRRLAEKRALEILELVGMLPKKDFLGKNLTVADRKRLEVARALATGPDLLLLDEVMAGLNPKETEEAILLVKEINRTGVTLLVVEHVMQVIMSLSNRIAVIHHGEKIAEGSPSQVGQSAEVIKAYLGKEYVVS